MDRAYAVVDDFLPPREHQNLWEAFQAAGLSPSGAFDWNRVYRLMDGEIPVTSVFAARPPSLRDGTAGDTAGPAALRVFSEKLLTLAAGAAAPVAIDPWTGFSQSLWIYRPGEGLEWHSDTGWLGAYIYYMHPVWRPSWGGELLVADGDCKQAAQAASRAGDGVSITPRPNRLVLLRGGTFHCIRNVERAAGEAFRASVSGFFLNSGDAQA
jgi:hypothetical protein